MRSSKPVENISDRAKRYRANKIHKLRKRCEECGSRENLGVGHRDGDESNNRPSNLFTQCKSCNGRQAVRDKKAGRGVRTRQYNPGAINLAQYVQAAMDHVRGSHDAAGKVLHETPKAVRRQFAREIWFRRGYRGNPPADIMPEFWAGKLKDSSGRSVKTVAQARAILLSELRALGEIPARKNPRGRAAGELEVLDKDPHTEVDYEPHSKHLPEACANCRNFINANPPRCLTVKSPISPKAWCERYESAGKNPRRNLEQSEADKLYKKFHGRGPDKIYQMQVAGIDPYGGHPELTSLGPLIRLIVGEGVKLGGQYGDEVQEAEWVREISFVPSVARWHEWLEQNEPTIAEVKAKLREWKVPDLAAVPNTRQLYILGRQQFSDSEIAALKSDPSKDILDLGDCALIEYFAQKRFDHFDPVNYFHHFGETTGTRPRVILDRVHGVLSLAGGE